MNTREQGDLGVALAIAYYTLQGYSISIPISENNKYDLIVDKDNTVSRVQVKTTRHKTKYGIFTCQLKTCGGNQSWSGVVSTISSKTSDIVFIYALDGIMWEIPTEDIDNQKSVNLGPSKDKYRRVLGIGEPKDL